MKLEGVDPEHQSVYCVLTVAEVSAASSLIVKENSDPAFLYDASSHLMCVRILPCVGQVFLYPFYRRGNQGPKPHSYKAL